MSPRTARAILWFERGGVIEAEAELRAALPDGEDNAEVRAMLALCLLRCGLRDEAAQEIKTALGIDPSCAFAHYANSYVEEAELEFIEIPFLGRGPLDGTKARGCLKSIRQAVELEPAETRFLLRLAEVQRVLFNRWHECLATADRILSLEPNHLGAAIERATALSHLRKKTEARETLAKALSTNPTESAAHTGLGWALLHAGNHSRATQFFEEGLRLDARNDWAQAGALESAKHRYRSYRFIAAVKYWFMHQPLLLRAIYGLGATISAGVLLVRLFEAVDPFVRSRLGNEGTALVMSPIMFGAILAVMFHDYLFLWLVRRDRAALTTTGTVTKAAVRNHLWLLIPGLLAGFGAYSMQRHAPRLLEVALGLTPGCYCLWIVSREFTGAVRRWWATYAIVVLVAGPVVALRFSDSFRNHDRMWILIALIAPIVAPAVATEWHKKRLIRRAHDEALASVSQQSEE